MDTSILDRLIDGLDASGLFDLSTFITVRADAAVARLSKTEKYVTTFEQYNATFHALSPALSEEWHTLPFAMDASMGTLLCIHSEACYKAGLKEGIALYHIFQKAIREGTSS